jgi:septum formation protein
MSQELVLASTSPRRKELLQQIGVEFTQISVDINEDVQNNESAESYVLRLAAEKSYAGFQNLSSSAQENCIVLSADTTVVCAGNILGKPENLSDCKEILMQLSAQEHSVLTAVGLHTRDRNIQKLVSTRVRFRKISEAEIEAYWKTGEPQDKAGSYGIQGFAAVFVESIQGSYSNVVGLPLCETAQLLNQFNIPLWQDSSNASAESK